MNELGQIRVSLLGTSGLLFFCTRAAFHRDTAKNMGFSATLRVLV